MIVLEGRRRHGEAGEAARLTTGRRHGVHHAQPVTLAGGRHDDRFGGALQHGGELGEVVAHGVGVLGQPHRHDEIDVGQRLTQRRQLPHVGEPCAPAAHPGLMNVEAVRPGAVVLRAGPKTQHGAVPGGKRSITRRRQQGLLHQVPAETHPIAIDVSAGRSQHPPRPFVVHLDPRAREHAQGRIVHPPAGLLAPHGHAGRAHSRTPRATSSSSFVRTSPSSTNARGASRNASTRARTRSASVVAPSVRQRS